MPPKGEAILGQHMLPLIPSSNVGSLAQEALGLFRRSEPFELGPQRMLGGQERLLSVKDGRVANRRMVTGPHPEGLEMNR